MFPKQHNSVPCSWQPMKKLRWMMIVQLMHEF